MANNTLLDNLRRFQESPPTPSQLVEVVTLENSNPHGKPLSRYAWVTVIDMGALLVQPLAMVSVYGISCLLENGTLHAEDDTYPATLKDSDGNRYTVVLRNIIIPEAV